jgi:hypothetical protein
MHLSAVHHNCYCFFLLVSCAVLNESGAWRFNCSVSFILFRCAPKARRWTLSARADYRMQWPFMVPVLRAPIILTSF